jgi:hypothetical protein
MRFLSWYLWIAPHVLLGICLFGILRRGHYRRLPWFLAYTAFLSIQFVGCSPLHYTSFEELGLLISLLFFSRALQISWQSLPAGIALGLGISASAELSGAALLSVLGRAGYIPVDFIRMGAFHLCVVIWLVYIFLPSRSPSFTGHRPDRTDLEAWDQYLQKMVR